MIKVFKHQLGKKNKDITTIYTKQTNRKKMNQTRPE